LTWRRSGRGRCFRSTGFFVETMVFVPQSTNLLIAPFPLRNNPHCCVQLWFFCLWIVALHFQNDNDEYCDNYVPHFSHIRYTAKAVHKMTVIGSGHGTRPRLLTMRHITVQRADTDVSIPKGWKALPQQTFKKNFFLKVQNFLKVVTKNNFSWVKTEPGISQSKDWANSSWYQVVWKEVKHAQMMWQWHCWSILLFISLDRIVINVLCITLVASLPYYTIFFTLPAR
jgi:hypothetical protein